MFSLVFFYLLFINDTDTWDILQLPWKFFTMWRLVRIKMPSLHTKIKRCGSIPYLNAFMQLSCLNIMMPIFVHFSFSRDFFESCCCMPHSWNYDIVGHGICSILQIQPIEAIDERNQWNWARHVEW